MNAPKIKFFREPRLGAYMAFNITYQSSLNYKSLLSAIDNLNEYQAKLEEEEKNKAAKKAGISIITEAEFIDAFGQN